MIEFPKLGYELHELLHDEDGTGCNLSYNIPCGFTDIFMVSPLLHIQIRKCTCLHRKFLNGQVRNHYVERELDSAPKFHYPDTDWLWNGGIE